MPRSRRPRSDNSARKADISSAFAPMHRIGAKRRCRPSSRAASINSSTPRATSATPSSISHFPNCWHSSASRNRRNERERGSASGQRMPDHARDFGLAVWLSKQQHAGIESTVMENGVFGIARREQYLHSGPTLDHFLGKLTAVDRARHNDVGEQQIKRLAALDDRQRLSAARHRDRLVTEALDLGRDGFANQRFVLAHADRFHPTLYPLPPRSLNHPL